MAATTIVKVGAFTNDVAKQINDMFTELYATTAVSTGLLSATAGVATASKAAILGTTKNLDEFHTAALYLGAAAGTLIVPTAAAINLLAQGVAAGYKVARGIHTQVAASDTIVTGLATVVAVVVQFQSAPTVKQLYCVAQIGNQSGAPAAGSILMNTYKPTAVDNCTPTAATDFSENLGLAWVAIGT